MYNYVVLVEAPKSVRSYRVRNRSLEKFGDRMLRGGDLHEQEEAFFRMVDGRGDDFVMDWVKAVKCPIIRVDGTKPIEENVEFIMREIGI